MKETRKQKLRKREEKQRRAEDRKYAILDRLLDMYGIKSLLRPLDWLPKAGLATGINPRLEVEISDESKQDPLVAYIKSLYERAIESALPIFSRWAARSRSLLLTFIEDTPPSGSSSKVFICL